MKKILLTTALFVVAFAAGSQEPVQMQPVQINFASSVVSALMEGYWKHVGLMGLMATGVFLSIIRK